MLDAIDKYYGYEMEAKSETRYFDPTTDSDGPTLKLDKPLLTITTLTNGDSSTIAAAKYKLWPYNGPRYSRIILKASSGLNWTYTDDPEGSISVAGTWGYATTCPAVINLAARKWVAYAFRAIDSQVFDVTAQLATGQMIIPRGIPADVKVLLDTIGRSPL
ncbi:MAG TPA: hypothetical protein PK406_00630 [Verrucomicrobiota bacterium]|nr:hypothetical protein [Verrucomicrobiota bacterium]